MKLDSVDILPEDIGIINTKDSLRYSLTPEDCKISHAVPCVIKYDYIDLGITAYHFKQEFKQEEIRGYFERVKLLTTTTIDTLRERARELHLHRNDIKGNLKRAVGCIYPEMLHSNPIIYHCSLLETTPQERADRAKGIRNPRIYFMLGTNGHVYMLFFDPFHELNP